MKRLVLFLSVCMLAHGCCRVSEPGPIISNDTETVAKTEYGMVEGYLDDGIYTFKGIPYAKVERFMPPQNPDCWEGLRQCKIYGPQAMQGGSLEYNPDKTDYDFGFQFLVEKMSEKYSNVLNVWTPGLDDGKKRPVFFWIHGGGYASGSSIFLPAQEGRALAERGDIVVVTVNHRLNVLGYADLTALGGRYSQSVNLGMQDLVKALEWVRDNIGYFGGDPDSVTIGGQSGGGGKVSTLMAMPSASGLFHRAIVQSGSTLRVSDRESAQRTGLAMLEELGIKPEEADRLADVPYAELSAAAGRASRKVRGSFSPVVDGEFIIQHPFDPAAPEISRNVPMLIGSNLNEFTYSNNVEVPMEEARRRLAFTVGEDRVDAFIDEFEKVYPGGEPKELLYTDLRTRANVIRQAEVKSAQEGAEAYVYLFKWKSDVSNGALAACHGMELPFMFGNVRNQREMTGGTKEAYKLEKKVSSAWISFIRTGVPAAKGLPEWEPFTAENRATMILDNRCELLYNHDKVLLDLSSR